MIGSDQIRDILSLYSKHGWILSRVLLSRALANSLTESRKKSLFGQTSIEAADFDALWFERTRGDGFTAWEIRLLSATPYAICESLNDTLSVEEIEAAKRTMENRVRDHASK